MSFEEFAQQLMQPELSPGLLEKPVHIEAGTRSIHIIISRDPAGIRTRDPIIPLDYAKRMPRKVLATLGSRLGLNATVFARSCNLEKISRSEAEAFLEQYHLMSYTSSAYNYGLLYKNELLAVAAFSKGRKMNRLPADQRSFELIRFCCKDGITIAGGLTKLVKNFCREKKAGDVMTYVDKQLSGGQSFIKAGFELQGETAPNYFLVDKLSFERTPAAPGTAFNARTHYATHNCGNLKLIYTPHD